jgi:2-iminobutanoate/2-iminopropanoate deaminase
MFLTSMKKAIHIPGAPAPIGPYSQAILINDTLYISGQIPLNPFNGQLETGSIEDATRRVLNNIMELLKEVDMDASHVVKCSIFMKSMDDFAAMNAIYAEYFHNVPPARETVQVAKLPLDVPIEISCIAIR